MSKGTWQVHDGEYVHTVVAESWLQNKTLQFYGEDARRIADFSEVKWWKEIIDEKLDLPCGCYCGVPQPLGVFVDHDGQADRELLVKWMTENMHFDLEGRQMVTVCKIDERVGVAFRRERQRQEEHRS